MTHQRWWDAEGSAMQPNSNEDMEEFAKRITAIAWSNGAYVEREACAEICDRFQARDVGMQPAECAGAIRARGEA